MELHVGVLPSHSLPMTNMPGASSSNVGSPEHGHGSDEAIRKAIRRFCFRLRPRFCTCLKHAVRENAEGRLLDRPSRLVDAGVQSSLK